MKNNAVWMGVRPFFIGGSSACAATCCIQPLDMIKVRIQLAGGSASPIAVASSVIAKEGPLALYSGLSAALLRQLTYGMTRLGIFQGLSEKFKPAGKTAQDLPFLTKLGCSLSAGGIGALVGTPADAALVRMQADTTLPVDQRRNYKNGLDAMIRMAREEGVAGFFSGATPTIYRGLAINVGMLTSYGYYKQMMGPYLGADSQSNRFFCGFLSGWTAASVSLPFDYIKTMLQKQKPDASGKLPYNGVLDVITKTVATEGPFAFYKGYLTFCVRITPHIMLTWVFMDNMKVFLKGRDLM